MTQRVFDRENEYDMQDLWDILPDNVYSIKRGICDSDIKLWYKTKGGKTSADCYIANFLKINWHDKTEITRPIQEATKEDINKLCYFWEEDEDGSKDYTIGLLTHIDIEDKDNTYHLRCGGWWKHARRLTKQEIRELI